jgi:transcriptional regulator with XRE-family HTH domain
MFYDNLKKVCDSQGLKVTRIVQECGGSKGSISGWKSGAYPNSGILLKISVRLGVSCDYLLTGDVATTTQPLTEAENDMLDNFRQLTSHQQCKLIVRAEDMVKENQKSTPQENVG